MKRSRLARKSPIRRRSRGKFGAIPTAFAGRTFDSKLEAAYARKLDLLRSAIVPDRDRPVAWKPQVSVRLEVNGKLICRYICDFLVTFADGHDEWHEVKGFETETWKIKEKLFRALFPERRLLVVRVV